MLTCPKCQTGNHGTANFCESCGHSLESMRELDDEMAEMLNKEARKGAYALGVVTAIQVVAVLITAPDDWALWTVAGIFGALALWAVRAPLVASAVGLSVFVLLHGADAVLDPSTLFKGILMKVVVITVLVNAIRSGIKHRQFQRERGVA